MVDRKLNERQTGSFLSGKDISLSRARYTLQKHVPNDLLSPTKPYLLK
jgi:hypothetical protein